MVTHSCLCDLYVGQKARVLRVAARGELGRRIRDLGIVSGALIELLAEAPLLDPIAIKVNESVISLRISEAKMVQVTIEGQQA